MINSFLANLSEDEECMLLIESILDEDYNIHVVNDELHCMQIQKDGGYMILKMEKCDEL